MERAKGERRKVERTVLWQRLLYGSGVLSAGYFMGLTLYLGIAELFQWFWIALALFFIIAGRLLPVWDQLPRWFRICWKSAVILGLTVFLALMALIVSGMVDKPEPGADYVIVLGAKVNGETPSLALRYRIEAAYEYLAENDGTKAVASGGQGPNEGISEAQAIFNMLVSMGLDESRIIMEDQSTSTAENMIFSKEKIQADGGSAADSQVVVVTSDFHVSRARAIARNLGYQRVEGKSAPSVPGLQIHYCVRECFAILNDGVRGNLKLI